MVLYLEAYRTLHKEGFDIAAIEQIYIPLWKI